MLQGWYRQERVENGFDADGFATTVATGFLHMKYGMVTKMEIGTFGEMLNEFEQGVTNFTDNGKCIECGSCCSRYLAMNQKEINTIKAYIKRHNIKQQKHALFVYKDPMFDATCPFLDDTKPIHKCLIYEVRPLICREFKCDKWHRIDTDGVLFKSNLHPVDVTAVFFGKGCDTCH